jgi:hypothetical protein
MNSRYMLPTFGNDTAIETAKVQRFDIRPTRELKKVGISHAKKDESSNCSQQVASTMSKKPC